MAELIEHRIYKSIFIVAPQQAVFRAITAAEHWDRYFTTGMELDLRPGGVCNFKWKNWGPELVCHESPGRVLEVDPPRRFVFEWGRPELKTVASMEIEPKYNGSVLTLIENNYPDTKEGWKYMLECSAHWGELLALIKFYVEKGITYQSPESNGYAKSAKMPDNGSSRQMPQALEPLMTAYAFNLTYARELMKDIDDNDLYRSFGAGLENHPAFIIGHISIAAALVAEQLGQPYDIPPAWDDYFRRKGPGDPRLPSPFSNGMPSGSELLAELERQHVKVTDRLRRLKLSDLYQPVEWRLEQQFPTLAEYLAFMCVTHESNHLGQLAAWRRAAGMESALARL